MERIIYNLIFIIYKDKTIKGYLCIVPSSLFGCTPLVYRSVVFCVREQIQKAKYTRQSAKSMENADVIQSRPPIIFQLNLTEARLDNVAVVSII